MPMPASAGNAAVGRHLLGLAMRLAHDRPATKARSANVRCTHATSHPSCHSCSHITCHPNCHVTCHVNCHFDTFDTFRVRASSVRNNLEPDIEMRRIDTDKS